MQRIPFAPRVAPEWRCGGLLTERSGGRHLAAGHPVNRIVQKKYSDGLATIGSMQNLRRSDGRQVAVSLVTENHSVRQRALDRGRNSRCAPMCHLHVADIEVIVGEYRAPDRAHQNRPVLNPQIVDGLRDELVHDAVPAARAVMRLVPLLGLPLERIVEALRPLIQDVEFRHGPPPEHFREPANTARRGYAQPRALPLPRARCRQPGPRNPPAWPRSPPSQKPPPSGPWRAPPLE